MKSLKQLLVAILVTLLVINVSAQTKDTTKTTSKTLSTNQVFIPTPATPAAKPKVISRIGLRGGLNFATAEFVADNASNQAINADMKTITRGSMMFFWENSRSEYFVTQVGLGYTGKGFETSDAKVTMDYIEIPIIWNFRLPIYGPVYIKGGFGPYFSFAFNGKVKDKLNNITLNDILEYTAGKNAADNKPFNPFDAGLVFGGSVEIKLPEGKILEVGANYQIGVQKISNKADDGTGTYVNPEVRNGVLSFNVAFLFDLNKAKKK